MSIKLHPWPGTLSWPSRVRNSAGRSVSLALRLEQLLWRPCDLGDRLILLVTQITVTHIFPQSGCEDVGDVHGLDLPLAAGLVQVEPLRVETTCNNAV